MADIQQQIADGAQPLARVDDVIAHGEAIPANVTKVRDKDGDPWWRNSVGHWHMNPSPDASKCVDSDACRYVDEVFWPVKVVEVDPEPQPAETLPVGAHAFVPGDRDTRCQQPLHGGRLCGRSPLALMHEVNEPAEPGPVVLSLPQVPDGAVALIGGNGHRWLPKDGMWWNGAGGANWRLVDLLASHGPLTVEFAPPREPRTWPKLTDQSDDDLPDVVDVEGRGRWRRHTPEGVLYGDGDSFTTLAELRTMGEVREVLT